MAVNHQVVGSNPTAPAKEGDVAIGLRRKSMLAWMP